MNGRIRQIIALLLCFSLIWQQAGFAQVVGQLDVAAHLKQISSNIFSQDHFRPIHLRYLAFDAAKNTFKLLLDVGAHPRPPYVGARSPRPLTSAILGRGNPAPTGSNDGRPTTVNDIQEETAKLMRYFLIGLTLPNTTFWVNLRPDAPDNIIEDKLAQTDIGRIMLEADVQLKKDTAAFTSPDTPEGREYWDKLYKKAGELFGSEQVEIPTYTRPWIVPGEIILRETRDEVGGTQHEQRTSNNDQQTSKLSAYVYKATLKVMLEEDYVRNTFVGAGSKPALQGRAGLEPAPTRGEQTDPRYKVLNEYSSELLRQLVIPKITRDVNSAKRYAPLRQVYYSLILAQWFKERNRSVVRPASVLPHPSSLQRIDSGNLSGLTSKEAWSKSMYFAAYQKSFKDGEYRKNETIYTPYGAVIRSYVSGGVFFTSSPALLIKAKEAIPFKNPSLGEAFVDYDGVISSSVKLKNTSFDSAAVRNPEIKIISAKLSAGQKVKRALTIIAWLAIFLSPLMAKADVLGNLNFNNPAPIKAVDIGQTALAKSFIEYLSTPTVQARETIDVFEQISRVSGIPIEYLLAVELAETSGQAVLNPQARDKVISDAGVGPWQLKLEMVESTKELLGRIDPDSVRDRAKSRILEELGFKADTIDVEKFDPNSAAYDAIMSRKFTGGLMALARLDFTYTFPGFNNLDARTRIFLIIAVHNQGPEAVRKAIAEAGGIEGWKKIEDEFGGGFLGKVKTQLGILQTLGNRNLHTSITTAKTVKLPGNKISSHQEEVPEVLTTPKPLPQKPWHINILGGLILAFNVFRPALIWILKETEIIKYSTTHLVVIIRQRIGNLKGLKRQTTIGNKDSTAVIQNAEGVSSETGEGSLVGDEALPGEGGVRGTTDERGGTKEDSSRVETRGAVELRGKFNSKPTRTLLRKLARLHGEFYSKAIGIVLEDNPDSVKEEKISQLLDALPTHFRRLYNEGVEQLRDELRANKALIDQHKGREVEYLLGVLTKDIGKNEFDSATLLLESKEYVTYAGDYLGVPLLAMDVEYFRGKAKESGIIPKNAGNGVAYPDTSNRSNPGFIILIKGRINDKDLMHELGHIVWKFLARVGSLREIDEVMPEQNKAFKHFRSELCAYILEERDIMGVDVEGLSYSDNREIAELTAQTRDIVGICMKIAAKKGLPARDFLYLIMRSRNFEELKSLCLRLTPFSDSADSDTIEVFYEQRFSLSVKEAAREIIAKGNFSVSEEEIAIAMSRLLKKNNFTNMGGLKEFLQEFSIFLDETLSFKLDSAKILFAELAKRVPLSPKSISFLIGLHAQQAFFMPLDQKSLKEFTAAVFISSYWYILNDDLHRMYQAILDNCPEISAVFGPLREEIIQEGEKQYRGEMKNSPRLEMDLPGIKTRMRSLVASLGVSQTVPAQEGGTLSSPAAETKKGGIDLRSLSPNFTPNSQLQTPNSPASSPLPDLDLDKELRELERLIAQGVIPAVERVQQYARSCCQVSSPAHTRSQALFYISEILRLEENYALPTEPRLKELLVMLESFEAASG